MGIAGPGLPVKALAAGDANTAQCPAETEASPGFRTYMPDCRAFELVTPPYKGGAVVSPESGIVSDDGNEILYGSAGAFAGAGNLWLQPNFNGQGTAYLAVRSATGWTSTVLTPPATTYPHGELLAASTDLRRTLWGLATTAEGNGQDIYMRNGAGEFQLLGPAVGPNVPGGQPSGTITELGLVGASNDLTHAVFTITGEGPDLWPGDTTHSSRHSLYEYTYTGAPQLEPTLVGVSNATALTSNSQAHLISECGTVLGSPSGSTFNAVSASGATIFFTAQACEEEAPQVDEIYARIDGARTVAISEPMGSDCEVCNTTASPQDAVFAGASRNGEQVFFTTEQELLPARTGNNLYEYDFTKPTAGPGHPSGRISIVSAGAANAEVQGVVRIAPDGSRVYYVARGALTGANAEGRAPVSGADNLYVYEPDPAHPGAARNVFIATLLTPSEREQLLALEAEELLANTAIAEEAGLAAAKKAEAEGASFFEVLNVYAEAIAHTENVLIGTRGPSGTVAEDEAVWQRRDARPAQSTADGGVLTFVSSADLTSDDTSTVPQLFAYDARTERLARVSIGRGHAYGTDGNVQAFSESPRLPTQHFSERALPTAEQTGRALSADGSSIFFTSSARLVPEASKGASNVYEYRDGDVFMTSGGSDASLNGGEVATRLWGIDPTGANMFFTSAAQLVPEDRETQLVLYDARTEGGLAGLPGVTGACAGDTCRGPAAVAPGLQSAATVQQGAGGNLPLTATGAGRPRSKSVSKAQKLERALAACRAKHRRRARRAACEKNARALYRGKSKQARKGAGR
jgi:hypothetical protein